MKVWAVAWNTYRGLLHNRALLALSLFFLFIFVSSAGGIYFAARLSEAGAAEQARRLFAQSIGSLLNTNAVFSFILAAFMGAFVLPGEIKSGTILPTLGRALSRSQYLLGLFLGINLLLATYLLLVAVAAAGLMLWSGVGVEPYLLLGLVYVVLIANVVAAIAFLFSVLVNPQVALVALAFFLSLGGLAASIRLVSQVWAERVEAVVDYVLPAWGLLNYSDYLQVTRTPTARSAEFFAVGLAHGLDYLAVFLLLALFAFRRRSLLPPS